MPVFSVMNALQHYRLLAWLLLALELVLGSDDTSIDRKAEDSQYEHLQEF